MVSEPLRSLQPILDGIPTGKWADIVIILQKVFGEDAQEYKNENTSCERRISIISSGRGIQNGRPRTTRVTIAR